MSVFGNESLVRSNFVYGPAVRDYTEWFASENFQQGWTIADWSTVKASLAQSDLDANSQSFRFWVSYQGSPWTDRNGEPAFFLVSGPSPAEWAGNVPVDGRTIIDRAFFGDQYAELTALTAATLNAWSSTGFSAPFLFDTNPGTFPPSSTPPSPPVGPAIPEPDPVTPPGEGTGGGSDRPFTVGEKTGNPIDGYVFTGTGQPGATIHSVVGGREAQTTVDHSGTWTLNIGTFPPSASGLVWTAEFWQVDPSGVTSPRQSVLITVPRYSADPDAGGEVPPGEVDPADLPPVFGNHPAGASPWEKSQPVSGAIGSHNREDFFAFTATRDGELLLTLADLGAPVVLRYWFPRDGGWSSTLTEGNGNRDSLVLSLQVTAGEEVVVSVSPARFAQVATTRYALSAAFADADEVPASADAPGGPQPGDTGLLELSSDLGWREVAGGVASVEGAVVRIGHAEGHADLLRIENGSVTVTGGTVTVDGRVLSGRQMPDRPLFDGSFRIDPATLGITGLDTGGQRFGLLGDGVGLEFAAMTLDREAVRLAADARFGGIFEALDTRGAPLVLRLDDDGVGFEQRSITLVGSERLSLPVRGAPMQAQFSDLGLEYDSLHQVLYLHGRAALDWGGPLLDQFAALGVDSSRLELDLARSPRAGERGNFLALRADEQGGLDWDIVGTVRYLPGDGVFGFPVRELSIGVNSIEQSLTGKLRGQLPFAQALAPTSKEPPTATGTLRGFWDPLRLDEVAFDLTNLDYPLAATGLFLNGGGLSASGLAAEAGADPVRSFEGNVRFTLGSSTAGPTPIRGRIDGSFGTDGTISAGFEMDSRLGYFLGDSLTGGFAGALQRYFGVDVAAINDFRLFSLSGQVAADMAEGRLGARLEAEVLQGVFSGVAFLDLYREADIEYLQMGATGRIGLPRALGGAGIEGHVLAEFSNDGDMSNDFVAAWGSVGALGRSFDLGVRVGFDGSFSRLGLGGEPIPRTNSWDLDGADGYTLLSAHWDRPTDSARLTLVAPDGRRIDEAAFDLHADIALVEALNTDISRHAVLRDAAPGLWRLEVAGAQGAVRTEANGLAPSPSLGLAVVSVDPSAGLATLEVRVQDAGPAARVALHAGPEPGVPVGQRIAELDLAGAGGTRRVDWDIRDLPDGAHHLHAVLETDGQAPVLAFAVAPLVLDNGALVSALPAVAGQVVDRAGNELAGTSVIFVPEAGSRSVHEADATGRFGFDLPAGTAGRLTAERALGPGDPAPTTASALEALRLAVGLNPSWGPAAPMDFIAADFNGDGQVTTADALAILRVAVGLATEHAPRWVFVDSAADLSQVDRSNTAVETGRLLERLAADTTDLALTGVLLGHVQEYA